VSFKVAISRCFYALFRSRFRWSFRDVRVELKNIVSKHLETPALKDLLVVKETAHITGISSKVPSVSLSPKSRGVPRTSLSPDMVGGNPVSVSYTI
jgi:hypothetical protein